MPKSKVRKKTDYTINPASRTPVKVKTGPSSSIYVGVMLGLMLLGLAWLIVYYLAAITPSTTRSRPPTSSAAAAGRGVDHSPVDKSGRLSTAVTHSGDELHTCD